MTAYIFKCSACGAEGLGSHDGYGGSNAPKGWVQVTTEPLHVSRSCGVRNGTTAKTLCPACVRVAEPAPIVLTADIPQEVLNQWPELEDGMYRIPPDVWEKVTKEGRWISPNERVPEPKADVSEWDAVEALRFLLSPTRRPGEVLGLCRAVELAKSDAPYREHAAKTGDPIAPAGEWSRMPSGHVFDWTLADGLRFALYWAQVWHKQAGGYLATGTANGLDRVLRMLKENDACFDRRGLRDEIQRLLGRFQTDGGYGLTTDAIMNRVVHAFGLPFGTAFGLPDAVPEKTDDARRRARFDDRHI